MPGRFEPGNTLAAKSRMVEAMIRSVLAQDDRGRLRTAIERTLDKAANGDLPSLDWLTNRIDGKVKGDDGDNKSQLIQVVINGYADVQARIVDNSTVVADEWVGVVGGLLSDGGGGSREPVDGLSIPKNSDMTSIPTESTPLGIEDVTESEVVPSTTGG